MNTLPMFRFQDQQVRTIVKDGEPWFVAADVCGVLEIANHRDAVSVLSDKMKGVGISDTLGGPQEVTVISEAGVYKLAFRSRKPEAERFTDWLASEVIPSIRQTGGYILPRSLPEALRALADVEEKRQVLAAENAVLLPKADFYDSVMDSQDAIDMAAMAKLLGTGRNRLFSFLREQGMLMNGNRPYQEFVDREYFRVIETTFNVGDTTRIHIKTLVLPKGQAYIQRIYRRSNDRVAA